MKTERPNFNPNEKHGCLYSLSCQCGRGIQEANKRRLVRECVVRMMAAKKVILPKTGKLAGVSCFSAVYTKIFDKAFQVNVYRPNLNSHT